LPTGPARPAFARSASYGGYESAEARSAKAEVAGPMTSSARAGEGSRAAYGGTIPLTRLSFAPLDFATLSRKGRGDWQTIPAIIGALEAVMFERDEVLHDLHGRLVSAGINPRDPKVQTICDIVNTFYAEKTRQVLEQVQAVLSKIET
jgi:hypothetical protein